MQTTSVQNQDIFYKTEGGVNMFKTLKKRINNERGLTLIELLAVIVILAIVAAIAVPAIGNIINNSKDKAVLSEASNVLAGAKIARTDGACQTGTETDGNSCSQAELAEYVEGVGSSIIYSASYNTSNNTWTVQHSGLATFESKKFKEYFATGGAGAGQISKDNEITEVNLNAALQK